MYNIYNINERIYLPIAIVLAILIFVIISFHFYKKKKIALNAILSIWSICLSAFAFIGAFLRVDVYFTNDSFVGIMAGFMGACATILVGVQIYNSIDTRNSINKLKEKIEQQIKELNSDYNNRLADIKILNNKLQYDLAELKKELQQAKDDRILSEKEIKYNTTRATGLAFVSIQPFKSYANFYRCLQIALEINNDKLISNAISNMRSLSSIINNSIKKGEKISPIYINKIKNLDFKKIEKYQLSKLIEKEYNEIHNKMLNIIDSLNNK